MRVLLVHSLFPVTYWGFQDALRLIDKEASIPPLGLVSLAACLPESWELRLVDLNVRPLSDSDICWADAVFVGGMFVQSESMLEVLERAHEWPFDFYTEASINLASDPELTSPLLTWDSVRSSWA